MYVRMYVVRMIIYIYAHMELCMSLVHLAVACLTIACLAIVSVSDLCIHVQLSRESRFEDYRNWLGHILVEHQKMVGVRQCQATWGTG